MLPSHPEDLKEPRKMSDTLDEIGFVFLDGHNRPYKCAMWGEEAWLFYWHPDNHWVSLRKVSQGEIFLMPHNLSKYEQGVYDKLHDEYNIKGVTSR